MRYTERTTYTDLERAALELGFKPIICFDEELEGMIPRKKQSYIINLGGVEGGTHWTAFYISRKGIIIYFDSFGIMASAKCERFFRKISDYYIYNRKEIQDYNGGGCGQYCIEFLQVMNETDGSIKSFRHFLMLFKSNVIHNISILKRLLRR